MHLLKQYEQTAVFDPNNPNQAIREAYTPYGYSSYYFNQVPSGSTLKGLGAGFGDLPGWAQVGLVALVGAGAGYFAMAKWGDKIKPVARKVPIVGRAFAGLGRSRSRRRRKR